MRLCLLRKVWFIFSVLALFKMNTVRPLLHNSIMELTADKKLKLHSVLRECKVSMDIVEHLYAGKTPIHIDSRSLTKC